MYISDNMNILVIAAHADDETLGCGGTICKHIDNGDDVSVCIVTDGITARDNSDNAVKKRQNECIAACKILGVENLHFLEYKDQSLDSVPVIDLARSISEIIDIENPEIVYTHTSKDINQDHRAVSYATKIVLRPKPGLKTKILLEYKIPGSTNWNFDQKFSPNYFVDVYKYANIKINAINSYTSEIEHDPHPRSLSNIKHELVYTGSIVGYRAAEGFELVWSR